MKRFRLRLTTAVASASVLAAGGAVWLGTAPAAGAAPAAAPTRSTVLTAQVDDAPHHDMNSRTLLRAPLAPSVPGDPAIFGMAPGKVPWVIRAGHVRLSADGALRASVSGLVVPSTGKNPLPQVAAAVYCNGTQVAATAPVRFTPAGDAHLRATVALPGFCAAPAVLLEPASGGTMHNMYIAFDGKAS